MPAKLYVVHGSHPCATVQRALDMKAVPYEVVELLPPMHAALQRVRFGSRTVPGLTLESGEKLSGSRMIVRRLEELAPEPPLFPTDDEEHGFESESKLAPCRSSCTSCTGRIRAPRSRRRWR